MSVVRVAAGVASTIIDGTVYAAPMPDGPVLVLDGVGAVIWQQLKDDGELATLPARTAVVLLDPPADLDTQIEVFLDTLRGLGLVAS